MNRSQPARIKKSGVSWNMAFAVAGCGGVLLAAALYNTFQPAHAASGSHVDKELPKLQAQFDKIELELVGLREKGKGPAAELKNREESIKSLAERVTMRLAQVKDLEEKNAGKIRGLAGQAEETKRLMEKERAALAQSTPKEVASSQSSDAMTETLNSLATIVSSRGTVGTGFFFAGFTKPTIITTAEIALPGEDLSVKLRNVENAGDNEPFNGTARLAYVDTVSGLAFLTFTPSEAIKIKSLTKKMIRDPQQGERVYTISTLLRGVRFGEFSVFDGSVSAIDRMQGEHRLLQLAAPANPGSSGSPVLGADRMLLGIIVSPVEGIDKAALAIPAVEIQNAMKRMIESLTRK